MSYEKQTWATGDIVTSSKLNHMEDGIAGAGGGGPLIVNIVKAPDEVNNMLDKTWTEIHDALLTTGVVVLQRESDEGSDAITVNVLSQVIYDSEFGYLVIAASIEYLSQTADGYPKTGEP